MTKTDSAPVITTIARRDNGLRIYYIADRAINTIKFYRDGVVVLTTRSAWIEQDQGRDLPGLTLHHPVRTARKLDLGKGGHFTIATGKLDHWHQRSAVDLYVDLALDGAVGAVQTVELYRTDGGVTYEQVAPLTAVFATAGEQTINVAIPNTLFVQPNAYGIMLAEISAYMSRQGMDHVRGIETIIKDKPLLDLLLRAHALVADPQG